MYDLSLLSLWILKTDPFFFFFSQIKSAAVLANLDIDEPVGYEHMVDNKKPEFLSKFPHGKIPAFESREGFKLFEGVPIGRYGE